MELLLELPAPALLPALFLQALALTHPHWLSLPRFLPASLHDSDLTGLASQAFLRLEFLLEFLLELPAPVLTHPHWLSLPQFLPGSSHDSDLTGLASQAFLPLALLLEPLLELPVPVQLPALLLPAPALMHPHWRSPQQLQVLIWPQALQMPLPQAPLPEPPLVQVQPVQRLVPGYRIQQSYSFHLRYPAVR